MEQFMKEKFDFKRFFLIGTKRIWIVLLGIVLGAAFFGGSYYVKRVLLKGNDIYRVDGMYNIEFDMELYGDTVQYYNDFTWNDVIDSDAIGGKVAETLGVDKSVIYNSTFVPTMSDIRIIHVYIDNEDADLAGKIQEETGKQLALFGSSTPGFLSINKWSVAEPFVVEKDFLIKRITFIGAFLGFVLGLLFMFYKNAMDDSVYTLKDAENYSGTASAGYDCDNNIKAVLKQLGSNDYIASSLYKSGHDFSKINSVFEELGIGNVWDEDIDDSFLEKAKQCSGVIIVIPYGVNNGMLINSQISKLKVSGINIATTVVANGNEKFVKAYYRGK